MRTHVPRAGFLHHRFFCLLLIIGLVLAIDLARAEDASKEIDLKVTGAWWPRDDRTWWWSYGLNLPVWITIENLGEWAKQPRYDPSKFTLCINGTPFKGRSAPFITEGKNLGFELTPTPEFKDTWKTFVGRSLRYNDPVYFTVLCGDTQLAGSAKTPIPINWRGLKIFSVVVVIALVLFWWLAYRSDIVRVAGDQPTGTDAYGRANRKGYSLARIQMAVWFFVVVISFVFIWMVTDDLASLTPSVLTLIGISAATGLGSAIVDSSKRGDQENLLRSLEEKKKKDQVEADKLHSEINSFGAILKAVPAPADLEQQRATIAVKQGDLAAKEKEIKESKRQIQEVQQKMEPVPSKGFVNDILSDEGGISFHRFQMLAWTLVLAFIFISKVVDGLVMPDFDTTLLALMGISGGTYVGFKLPSQQG